MGLLPMDKLEVAGVGAVEEVVRMPDPGSSQEGGGAEPSVQGLIKIKKS